MICVLNAYEAEPKASAQRCKEAQTSHFLFHPPLSMVDFNDHI